MRIVLLGLPGSGKGTQAKLISKWGHIPQISMGDLLRDESKKDTDTGRNIKKIIDNGNLVPDILTIELLEKRIKEKDCKNGYILDGFPRDLNQAKQLKEISDIDCVILIDVSDDEVLERVTKRRICDSCGAIYHLSFNPPQKNGRCKCGGQLSQREDDHELSVRTRLEVYHELTEPVLDFYRKANLLVSIDGERPIEDIFEDIKNILSE